MASAKKILSCEKLDFSFCLQLLLLDKCSFTCAFKLQASANRFPQIEHTCFLSPEEKNYKHKVI